MLSRLEDGAELISKLVGVGARPLRLSMLTPIMQRASHRDQTTPSCPFSCQPRAPAASLAISQRTAQGDLRLAEALRSVHEILRSL